MELELAVERHKHLIYCLKKEVEAGGEQHCITAIMPHFAVMSAYMAKPRGVKEGEEVDIVPYAGGSDHHPANVYTVRVRLISQSGYAILHSPVTPLCSGPVTMGPAYDGLSYNMLHFDKAPSRSSGSSGRAVLKCKRGMMPVNQSRVDNHNCFKAAQWCSERDISAPCFDADNLFRFIGICVISAKQRSNECATLDEKLPLIPDIAVSRGYIVPDVVIHAGIGIVKGEIHMAEGCHLATSGVPILEKIIASCSIQQSNELQQLESDDEEEGNEQKQPMRSQ